MIINSSTTRGWTLTEKLAFYSAPVNENGCIIWRGVISDQGYGLLYWQGSNKKAHRLSLEQHLGRPIKEGLHALHNCPGGDNPACIAPDHLWEGTQTQNIHDSMSKGTHVIDHPQGENHGMAQLTEKDVYVIRASHLTQKILAAKFGVSQPQISSIIRRESWTHLPERIGDRSFVFDRLTPEQKVQIAQADGTRQAIADRFGVSRNTVSRIHTEARKHGPKIFLTKGLKF